MDTPTFEEIAGHRPRLMRYALAQLRGSHLAEERDRIEHHLSLCTACRNFKVQVGFLRGTARRHGPQGGGAQ